MSVSTVSALPPTILSPTARAQGSQVHAAADNDGDADDFGGPADNDSVASGSHVVDITA